MKVELVLLNDTALTHRYDFPFTLSRQTYSTTKFTVPLLHASRTSQHDICGVPDRLNLHHLTFLLLSTAQAKYL